MVRTHKQDGPGVANRTSGTPVSPEVQILADDVIIKNIVLTDRDLASFLQEQEESVRPDLVRRGLKIGLLALRDYVTVAKADYVEKEFETWWHRFQQTLNGTFDGDNGTLAQQMKRYFGEEGQVAKTMARHFDPENVGSFPRQFREIIERNISGDGSPLRRLLDPEDKGSPLNKLQESLRKELQELREFISREEGKDEEAELGTQKGRIYEQFVFDVIDGIGARFGDTVEFVGNMTGVNGSKHGDVLVTLNSRQTNGKVVKVVFEAKDRKESLPALTKELDSALENREATRAIAVFHDEDAIPVKKLYGAYRQYKDHYFCIMNEEDGLLALEIAYQQARIDALSQEMEFVGEVDTARARRLLDEAIGKLDSLNTMKSRLNRVSKEAMAVRGDLGGFQEDLRDLLDQSLDALTVEDEADV